MEDAHMDTKDTARLEAFSDGVIAVAITLLVLNIVPTVETVRGFTSDAELGTWVGKQLPAFFTFLTSFLTIGVMWLNHHRLFKHIEYTDTWLLVLNLLLLLLIVFVPVPTALLGDFIANPSGHAAAMIYSGTFVVLAISFNLLWRYASHNHRLLDKNADKQAIDAISKQYMFGPLFYVVTLLVAIINVPAGIILNFALALFFALPGRSAAKSRQSI
jgi:uncharacterized membrane protein